jgi:EAL domain-containing protein (putative c-di-GMP-specific phosphodiesterase class I)/CHASE2 domain-containing sensor protein/GGDEF domain-containing protein
VLLRSPEDAASAGEMSDAPRRLHRRRRYESWTAALFVLVLTAILLAMGALEPIEYRLTEARARLLDRAPTGEVAIVEIDAKSLSRLDTWPWSRQYHANLLDRLGAAGVSMVGFDVDFSARSDPAGDQALARALTRVQPVILPVFEQRASTDPSERSMIDSRPADPFRSAWVGGVNIVPGRDGVVRDFPPAMMINGRIEPALAVLMSDDGSVGDRAFAPDWSIDVRQIPRFSFIDVLDGKVPAKALAKKRIIVGATAIELGDRYTIPRFGAVPGVIIQALATESLIQHRALVRSGLAPTLVGLLLISLLWAGGFERFGRTFPLVAGATLAGIVIVPIAVQARWPLSIDSAPWLTAALGGIAFRTIVEVRHRIRLAAIRDPDTGLPNELALGIALDDLALPEISVTAAAVQRFEAIRSAAGSRDVAEMMTKAAERVAEVVRTPVYRIAPDTLAWVTPIEADPEKLSTDIADGFVQPISTGSGPIDVRWTFGMAAMTPGAQSAELIERARAAITRARTQGQSRQWFQGQGAEARRDLSMMGELLRGIEDNELFVAYQPKLHLKSGNITQAEALVRWRHPTEGLIRPDRFIPLAEETGVVREITRFVLRRVIADCLSQRSGRIGMSINISAADIIHPGFADELIAALSESGLDPSRLTLEITESAIIRSRETALHTLHALRDHGVRLSIDDYGTGQSTLSYVKTLPVDELKIDKGFVTSLSDNESDRIMVRSTIDLAHQLGLSVVAEGVEDSDTARILTDLGCDYAQGFAIGRAMSINDLHSLARAALKRAA